MAMLYCTSDLAEVISILPHIGNLYDRKMQSSTSTLAAQKLNIAMENLLDAVHGKLVLWNTKDGLIILQ